MWGLWGEVLAIVNRVYRRKVFHKRRVLVLLREFRRMTSAMPDGAILLGQHREILWFNRTAGRWLDLKRKVDYGLRIDNLVRHPDFIEYLERRGTSAPPRIHFPKHGDRWLLFRLVTTNTTGQQLLILRDVTSEARLESMRKDFVANASHELRSPLTVISGYLDSLADDATLDPAWQAPVQEMRRQSDRMRNIVQDLLELSRLEAQSGDAERSPVDVGGMLALIRKETLARPEHPAVVELHLDSDALPARGRDRAAFDLLQPGLERGEVHAGQRPHRHPLVDGRPGRARRGPRHRASAFPTGAPAAPHRTLLPRRSGPLAQARRLRARPRDCEARVTASRRSHGSRKRRGQGQHVHLSFSGCASRTSPVAGSLRDRISPHCGRTWPDHRAARRAGERPSRVSPNRNIAAISL